MTGEQIASWGVVLTLLLTLPIVGAVMFGIPGFVIGLLIGLVFSAKPLQKVTQK